MSNHRYPECASEQACEALVKGRRGAHWNWAKRDHRCPRKATQSRDGLAVCYIHAKTGTVEKSP